MDYILNIYYANIGEHIIYGYDAIHDSKNDRYK